MESIHGERSQITNSTFAKTATRPPAPIRGTEATRAEGQEQPGSRRTFCPNGII